MRPSTFREMYVHLGFKNPLCTLFGAQLQHKPLKRPLYPNVSEVAGATAATAVSHGIQWPSWCAQRIVRDGQTSCSRGDANHLLLRKNLNNLSLCLIQISNGKRAGFINQNACVCACVVKVLDLHWIPTNFTLSKNATKTSWLLPICCAISRSS